ncbi:MAG: ATP-binding protein [Pseudorhodoferax sp.]
MSLRPSFARTPYRIETEVPAQGLRLDSYPGALGQALGNLLQNAVLHGFDGRAQGTVRITAGRAGDGRIWLRVADDGRGIAPELIGRIFDPFMTTKMGQGGTGLGLHISYNAVVNLLGGTLTAQQRAGARAPAFELRLPDTAPRASLPPLAPGANRRRGPPHDDAPPHRWPGATGWRGCSRPLGIGMGLGGCGPRPPLRLGFLVDRHGVDGNFAEDARNGIVLAVEECNSRRRRRRPPARTGGARLRPRPGRRGHAGAACGRRGAC